MEMDELNEKARRSKHQAAGGGGRGRLLMEGGAHTGGGPCPGGWLRSLLAHTWPALCVAVGGQDMRRTLGGGLCDCLCSSSCQSHTD